MNPLENIAMRDACAQTLVEQFETYDKMVVLDADVSKSTKSFLFGQAHPERFFNLGIAEQNMVGVAAGFAAAGMLPVVNTFSFLLSKKAADQLCQSIAYPKLNVKLMGHYAGLSAGPEGATHHALEDIGIIRSIPNITLLVPCDAGETRQAVRAALVHEGPVYVRLCRNPVPAVHTEGKPFQVGKGYELRPGSDMTIIATGVMVARALAAADTLAAQGIDSRVVAMPTLKPIDRAIIEYAARETGAILTAEEHNIIGGLGSAVAETLVETLPVPMSRVGIQDCFAESGDYFKLMDKYGLSVENITAAAKELLKRKSAHIQYGAGLG